MSKLFTLMFTVLLTVASAAGFVYLTVQINAGESLIAEGQELLAEGRGELKRGKARLAEGKQELAEGEKEFRKGKRDAVKDLLRGYAGDEEQSDAEQARQLLQGGREYQDARKRIAEGEKQIAEGERKVAEGKRRLAAGEQELDQGKERVQFAKRLRMATAAGAVVFGVLSIVLGFLWRRSLFRRNH